MTTSSSKGLPLDRDGVVFTATTSNGAPRLSPGVPTLIRRIGRTDRSVPSPKPRTSSTVLPFEPPVQACCARACFLPHRHRRSRHHSGRPSPSRSVTSLPALLCGLAPTPKMSLCVLTQSTRMRSHDERLSAHDVSSVSRDLPRCGQRPRPSGPVGIGPTMGRGPSARRVGPATRGHLPRRAR